jgi:putative lipase involved disintegration of autophagic bodies
MGYDSASKSIITSFRGSSNVMNFLEDADFYKVDYNQPNCNNCQVHQGFYLAYKSLKDDILAYAKTLKAKYSSATVVVTGHSLGAAEAMLGAVD